MELMLKEPKATKQGLVKSNVCAKPYAISNLRRCNREPMHEQSFIINQRQKVTPLMHVESRQWTLTSTKMVARYTVTPMI